jgi:hypothetical protein
MRKKIKKKSAPKVDAYKAVTALREKIIESIEMDSSDLIDDNWWQNTESPIELTAEVLRARRMMLLDKIRGSQWLLNDVNELCSALYEEIKK